MPGRRSPNTVILVSALWLTLFYNFHYFSELLAFYPPRPSNAAFLISVGGLQFALTLLLLSPFCVRPLLKPVMSVLFLGTALSAYFMDCYGVIIDQEMIRNILQTQAEESLDLVSIKLLIYLVLLGILPTAWLMFTPVQRAGFLVELKARLRLTALALVGIVVIIMTFYASYAPFFREHKLVRYYSNPLYPIYSLVKFTDSNLHVPGNAIAPLGTDARIPFDDEDRELIIMVVGETARADHFSLNDYTRQTNPLLQQENLFNFTHFSACGTSTAISVPCIFSILNRENFSVQQARHMENLLDVLKHAGVNVLWRDNNSSSKGVADRVIYQNYRDPDINPSCDIECRDEGMLAGLQEYIDAQSSGDILIVLHQMGNHGPAYYKRYPRSFEAFTPACQSNELQLCTAQEIDNAYDNALRYTDYFLAKTIRLLKDNAQHFETAMLYVSDHGESLGEHGVYLHGLPYRIAPRSQTSVPALLWLSENFSHVDRDSVGRKTGRKFSHDHLFHTVLGLFEIQSEVYDASMDILSAS